MWDAVRISKASGITVVSVPYDWGYASLNFNPIFEKLSNSWSKKLSQERVVVGEKYSTY